MKQCSMNKNEYVSFEADNILPLFCSVQYIRLLKFRQTLIDLDSHKTNGKIVIRVDKGIVY